MSAAVRRRRSESPKRHHCWKPRRVRPGAGSAANWGFAGSSVQRPHHNSADTAAPTNRPKRKIFEHPFEIPSRKRKTRSQKRQERKENAICRDCPNEAIPDRTRCMSCNEKHRARRQQSADKRRAATNCTDQTTQRRLLPDVAKREDPQPQVKKPTAIRPRRRARQRVNLKLQQPLQLKPPEPPVEP